MNTSVKRLVHKRLVQPLVKPFSDFIQSETLGGIGFTMSIFITLLAFAGKAEYESVAKMAILLASLLAGVTGYLLLKKPNLSPALPPTTTGD